MTAAVGVILQRTMGARAGEGGGVRVGRYPHGRRREGAAKRRHLERRKREKERRVRERSRGRQWIMSVAYDLGIYRTV